ncbi:hypothetical protein HAX54_030227 [Datura stramonium]|uniref:Uncharacterized protein n=1 Tax=Datura stramonium TaxID=4076 RepID=A0ABS8SAU5_DATST|nr:hypothetical protein [Datura stramonium]
MEEYIDLAGLDLGMAMVSTTWKTASTKGTLLKACFAAIMYEVWCERNSRIFQNNRTNKERMAHDIKTSICIRVWDNKKLFDVVCSL